MTEIDLDKMEADARAATQGEWSIDGPEKDPSIVTFDGWFVTTQICSGVDDDDNSGELNARHIANCSPPNILALIKRMRELEEMRKEFIDDVNRRWEKAESKEDWRKIDPDDPETWPEEGSGVFVVQRMTQIIKMSRSWRDGLQVLYSHWQPAHIPEPPK